MSQSETYFQNAELSQAAYANFESGNYDRAMVSTALQVSGSGDFSSAQAEAFTDPNAGFTVYHHLPDDATGFSATTFRNNATGEITIAIRGTDEPIDLVEDLLWVAQAGYSRNQIYSLYNYVQRLYTPANEAVAQWIEIANPNNGTTDPPEYALIGSAAGLGIIPPEARVNVTGHSLGGHLALAFARLFPERLEHAYVFNAPGLRDTLEVNGFFSSLGGAPEFPSARISNINGEAGPEIISQLHDVPGERLDIFIEDQAPTIKENHSIALLTDSLRLYSLLTDIDPTVSLEDLNSILAAGSASPRETLESMLKTLGRIYGVDGSVGLDDREALYVRAAELEQLITQRPPAQLVALSGQSDTELAAAAVTDPAYRHALQELDPLVIVGDDDLYPSDGAGTDAPSRDYLLDRATLLEWKLTLAVRDDADQVWPYYDRQPLHLQDLATGYEVWLGSDVDVRSLPRDGLPQIIFGSEQGEIAEEQLSGGMYPDRLYGGDGDDILTGYGGADYLEGDAGNDALRGGAGSDLLSGGYGYDRYEYQAGDGFDRIVDSDGLGELRIGGVRVTGGSRSGDDTYVGEDGTVGFTWLRGADLADALLITAASGRLLVEDFHNGDLGITLEDGNAAEPPAASRAIIGDYEPVDFDPGPATQYHYDDLGNRIVDPALGSRPVADQLYGSDGNDLVSGGQLTDRLEGRGGDDVLEGGAGSDILDGGAGADQLFAVQAGVPTSYAGFTGGTLLDAPGDWLTGGLGADLVVGSSAHDALFGGGGRDVVLGGAGDDVLDGDDDYVANAHDWTIDLSTPFLPDFMPISVGADAQEVGDGDLLYGGPGNDSLFGLTGEDWLYGEDGADVLAGGDDGDQLFGGAGDDRLAGDSHVSLEMALAYRSWGDDYLDGGTGDDALWGEGGDDLLFGGAGDDVLQGDGDLTPAIGKGDDQLSGGDGEDILAGDDGDDTLFGDAGDDELYGGTGRDRLEGGTGSDWLAGGADEDTLDGGDGPDLIGGGGGADYLAGGQGADRMEGDEGDDILLGEDGADILWGGDGADTILGGTDDDWLAGQAGDDYLSGGAGEDVLAGGSGADLLDGGPGTDRIIADADDRIITRRGSGSDYVDAQSGLGDLKFEGLASAELTLSTALSAQGDQQLVLTTPAGEAAIVSGGLFGRVAGFSFDAGETLDTRELLRAAPPLTVLGTAGDDALFGSPYEDHLLGSGGDDLLDGQEGDDVLEGGLGNDVYLFARGYGEETVRDDDLSPGNLDTVRLAADLAPEDLMIERVNDALAIVLRGTHDRMLLSEWFVGPEFRIEQLEFGEGESWMLASLGPVPVVVEDRDGRRRATGTPAADMLYGGAGEDTLRAGAGDDVLVGGNGSDALFGESGNDRLSGGAGNDRLAGGPGDDEYRFELAHGQDVVLESGADAGTNRIALGSGITPADLLVMRNESDLVLVNHTTSDRITLSGWFTAPSVPVAQVQFSDGTVWDATYLSAAAQDVSTAAQYIIGSAGDDTLGGGAGNDAVLGMNGNDWLSGGDGEDELDGGGGADVLNGGPGNDLLRGGRGDDEYRVQRGGGFDHIVVDALADGEGYYVWDGQQYNWNYRATDTLRFGPGIAPEDLSVQVRRGGEVYGAHNRDLLAIGIGDDEGVLIDYDYYVGYGGSLLGSAIDDGLFPVRSFLFDDGSTLDLEDLLAAADGGAVAYGDYEQRGTSGDDVLVASAAPDRIVGEAGNDWLDGRDQDDQLYGGAGDDALAGGSGDDLLEGGEGVDVMAGGAGHDLLVVDAAGGDTFVFNRGDGADQIRRDTAADPAGAPNTLSLGQGISPEQVVAWLTETGDLLLALDSGEPVAQIHAFLTDTPPPVARLQFIGPEDVQVYDLAGMVAALEEELRAADATAPLPLVTPQTADYAIEPEADSASVRALAYARTGMLNATGEILSVDGISPVHTGPGPDTIFVTGGSMVDAGDGDDRLTMNGTATLDAGNGNDYLILAAGSNGIVIGGYGDDRFVVQGAMLPDIAGAGGILIGGPGNDRYDYEAGAGHVRIDDLAVAGAGNVLRFGAGIDTGDLRLRLGSLIIGLDPVAGEIELDNFDAADVFGAHAIDRYEFADGTTWSYPQLLALGFDLDGGDADDLLSGTAVIDRMHGGSGNDVLRAGAGDDRLDGGDGDDALFGESGADFLEGGAGDDSLDGGSGADLMQGGAGDDEYYIDATGDVVVEAAGGGVDHVSSTIDYTLGDQVENLQLLGSRTLAGTGNGLGNRIVGNSENNRLRGGDGEDTLYGAEGNDVLLGERGDDALFAGPGAKDQLYGGAGNDALTGGVAASEGDADFLYGGAGDDVLTAGSKRSALDGGAGDDVLTGNSAPALLRGGAGDDVLTAGNHPGHATGDQLWGGLGNDRLQGGTGVETLWGGAGDDLLAGAAGDGDYLVGGLGSDGYAFGRGDGRDTIQDYDLAAALRLPGAGVDRLWLGDDIAPEQLWFRRSGVDLEAAVIGSEDALTVQGWYRSAAFRIEELHTADGRVLMADQVQRLVDAMAAFDPPAAGSTTLAPELLAELEPVLAAAWSAS